MDQEDELDLPGPPVENIYIVTPPPSASGKSIIGGGGGSSFFGEEMCLSPGNNNNNNMNMNCADDPLPRGTNHQKKQKQCANGFSSDLEEERHVLLLSVESRDEEDDDDEEDPADPLEVWAAAYRLRRQQQLQLQQPYSTT